MKHITRRLSFAVPALLVFTSLSTTAQTPRIGPAPDLSSLRAATCPAGYWLQTQAAPGSSLPAGMVAQAGPRLVARCVGLVVEPAPPCPAGAQSVAARGADSCAFKGGGLSAPAKPIRPICAGSAQLRIDGAGDADLCISEKIALPQDEIRLSLPWGFSLN